MVSSHGYAGYTPGMVNSRGAVVLVVTALLSCRQSADTEEAGADDPQQVRAEIEELFEQDRKNRARTAQELHKRLSRLDGDISLGLASRDPDAASGKVVCGTGVVASITKTGDSISYTGVLSTDDGVAVLFETLDDPGDAVALSNVRFCGEVHDHVGPALKVFVVLETVH